MPDLSSLLRGSMGLTTLIVAVPFVIIALVLLFIALRQRRKVSISRGWPVTTGRVLSADVEARRSRSGQSGYSTSYYANIVYEYQVGGQRYIGNRLSFGEVGLGFMSRVQSRVERYPVGSRVEVFYDPEDPGQAVLEHSSRSGNILLFVVLFIVAMLFFTVGGTIWGTNFIMQWLSKLMPK